MVNPPTLSTRNFTGKLTDFDSSLMAPSTALVARNVRFVDQNVAEPWTRVGRCAKATELGDILIGIVIPRTSYRQ